jgi:hypothetical protein
MPILHPDPPRIPGNLFSEQQVLSALRTLPPDAHVFARLAILDQSTNRDRELDFLVIHPELGLVIVEVKGSGVEPRGDFWIRKQGDGREEVLKETPGDQLREQQYSLLQFLQSAGLGFVPQVTRVLALPAFPIGDDESLGPDLPACRILNRAKLQRPYHSLREAVSGGADWDTWRRTPAGRQHDVRPDVLRKLLEVLTPRLLPPPPLAELLADEGRLQDATARGLLDHLALNFACGRFHVSGGPGSGKSLLARQVTHLWAAEGRRVLHVAFNRALTYATQSILDDLEREGRVTVSTYHDLAANLLIQAGQKPVNEDDSTFFNQYLPEGLNRLLATPESIPDRWDALVVDEAQDLHQSWVLPLVNLLQDPDRDPILLLEDPAQSIYREARHGLGQPWRIDLNLRQHPAIRRAACLAFPECGWEPPAEVPDDGAVLFHRSSPEVWKRDLATQLEALAKEGLQPHQVMILSPHKPETLGLKDGQVLGPWRLNTIRDWWEDEKAEQVRIGSVHAFKGLEADVVIYLAPAYRHRDGQRLAYTAYSRARHRLVVLEKAVPDRVKEKLPVTQAKSPAPAPTVPRVCDYSQEQRQNLMEALTAAKRWRPGMNLQKDLKAPSGH